MADSPQSTTETPQVAFRIKPEEKADFLRLLAQEMRPYKFITLELVEGDDLVLVVIPASSEPAAREKLAGLASQLTLSRHADSAAADRGDDIPI